MNKMHRSLTEEDEEKEGCGVCLMKMDQLKSVVIKMIIILIVNRWDQDG